MKLLAEQTLFECLDLLERGESIEQILARYPESADALRSFLTTAVHLSQLTSQPTLAAKQASQQRFLQRAAELRVTSTRTAPSFRWRRTLMSLASLAMVLFIVGVAFITTSALALPGDPLYGAKRLFEDIRLTRTGIIGDLESLKEQTQSERIREVESILQTDRDVPVEFEGPINAIQADSWLIADIRITVDRFTRIEGTPKIGSMARVNGRTHDGILRAISVTILSDDQTVLETPDEPELADTPIPSPIPELTTTLPAPMGPPPPDDNTNGNGDDDNVNTDNGDDTSNDNSDDDNTNHNDDNANDNSNDDEANDNNDDDNANDNSDDDNANDNSDDDNDNGNDDNANDNGNDDNTNDNGDDDNANDNGNDDNANDNSDDDEANDNGDDDEANDNGDDDDEANDNNSDDDNDNDNGNDDSDNDGNSGSGNRNDNDNS